MNVAVVDLIDDYIDRSARFAFQEFDGLRVVKDQVDSLDELDIDVPASQLKLRYRDRIRERIAAIKSDTQVQYHLLFEHTAGSGEVDDCLDACLEHDPYHHNVDEDRRDAYAEDMAAYLRSVGDAMAPLLAEEGDVWDVVTSVCDRDEAEERLTEPFRRSDVLAAYEDDVTMTEGAAELPLLPMSLDYSTEARRIFEHGEDYIHRVIAQDVDEAFDG